MPESLLVPVRVQPRGSRSEIVGVLDGRVKIRTTAAPADGQANRDVIRQLADAFDVPPSRVSLKRGAASRLKTFVIERPGCLPDWIKGIDFS